MNLLLDYFFPISSIEPTAQASTDFLKQVLLVVKPKVGAVEGVPTLVTTTAGIDAFTDNADGDQLFLGGMNRVHVVALDDLTLLAAAIAGKESDFFTIVINSEFSDAEVTAMDLGDFTGVVGVSSTDRAFTTAQAIIPNRVAFHRKADNGAKNMMFAFGKILSNYLNWRNQQYVAMPLADDVDTLGEAEDLFADKVSFVISDSQYGQRLGLFAAGGKAIFAPYVLKNLQIDMQSAALTFISGNQPSYTVKNATLLEDELEKVKDRYIAKGYIESGSVSVKADQGNFVASGNIETSEPGALWRIFAEMRQT